MHEEASRQAIVAKSMDLIPRRRIRPEAREQQ